MNNHNNLNKVSPEEQDRNLHVLLILFLIVLNLVCLVYAYDSYQQSKPKTPTEELIIENNKYIVK